MPAFFTARSQQISCMAEMKVISLMIIGAMVASLAACGGSGDGGNTSAGGENGGDSGTNNVSQSGDENTLTIYAWDENFNIPAIQAAADDYRENVNPDFELNISVQSGSTDIETLIKQVGTTGESAYSELPDLVLFQDHAIEKYVHDYPDVWQSIDDIDINWDDFAAEKIAYSTVDGVHYGVPMDAGTVIAAYRVDLLEAAGHTIDELEGCTWDEFLDIGEDVYNATGKYMMVMNADGNDLPYMMMQAEGQSQFKDGEPYLVGNETLTEICNVILEACERNVCYLANDWDDYTQNVIQGDMTAGIMNGNWIIPTMKLVEANAGKWEITSSLPTLNGGGGYAANGGSSIYLTANCSNSDLAKDFLAYTFGGSTVTYDNALLNGGVVSTYTPAGESDVYNEGVDFFNGTAVYAQIAEMTPNVPVIEQSSYHYTLRSQLSAALINVRDNGADLESALSDAENQVRFEMGLQ